MSFEMPLVPPTWKLHWGMLTPPRGSQEPSEFLACSQQSESWLLLLPSLKCAQVLGQALWLHLRTDHGARSACCPFEAVSMTVGCGGEGIPQTTELVCAHPCCAHGWQEHWVPTRLSCVTLMLSFIINPHMRQVPTRRRMLCQA